MNLNFKIPLFWLLFCNLREGNNASAQEEGTTTSKDESTNSQAEVEPGLLEHLSKYPRANIIVSFIGGNDEVLRHFDYKRYRSHGARLEGLTDALQDYTNDQQGGVRDFLESGTVEYESFWISNQIFVPKADMQLVSDIASHPMVMRVEKEKYFRVRPIIVATPANQRLNSNETKNSRKEEVQWSVSKIQAPEAWKLRANGSGIVVATIDSGARHTHESLKANHRSEYGWYDAYKKISDPYDDSGHGSHVLGSFVGGNGYGVAPGATWIACKGCHEKVCKMSQLLACGQWVLCPTLPDGSERNCSYAPRVVSNSWTGKSTDDSFSGVISAWRKGGIIPVFSIGNSGSNCSTAGSPGNNPQVIGVGSLDSRNRMSYFSSRGPTAKNHIKPDIVAYGSGIKSVWHKGDSEYNTMSGTSMSGPHVAGAIAVLLSVQPEMAFEDVWEVLTKSTDTLLDTADVEKCGNVSDKTIPNNIFGYGKVNVYKAVKLLI